MKNTKIDIPLTWAYYDLYGSKKLAFEICHKDYNHRGIPGPVAQGFFLNSSLGFLSTWTCNYADSTNLLNFQNNLKKTCCV